MGWDRTALITDGDWAYREFDDGIQQWALSEPTPPTVFIERVTGKSRRRRWVIADRRDPKDVFTKYPPKIAGPFPTLEAAKAAYRVMRAAGSI